MEEVWWIGKGRLVQVIISFYSIGVELSLAWLGLCCFVDWIGVYTLSVGVRCIHILCELIERIKIPYLSQILGSVIPGLIMMLASFG